MDEQRKAGKLAKGARGNPGGRGAKIVRVAEKPAQTLASQGVDKHLADRARKPAFTIRELDGAWAVIGSDGEVIQGGFATNAAAWGYVDRVARRPAWKRGGHRRSRWAR